MITFEHSVIDNDKRYIEFKALENNNYIGKCTLFLSTDAAEITEVCIEQNEAYIVEGLIRAAFNYAANRSYYIGICNAKGVEAYISNMNFSKTDKGYINDIPSILLGSCKSCKK